MPEILDDLTHMHTMGGVFAIGAYTSRMILPTERGKFRRLLFLLCVLDKMRDARLGKDHIFKREN